MQRIYLYTNAALYAVFAVWCTLAPTRTATSLGYSLTNGGGRSEYLVIYGGLQWGLAAIFAYLAVQPRLHSTGMAIALLFYAPLVGYRVVTVLLFHSTVPALTWTIGGLEVALLIWAVVAR